jgi:GH15 family glucan-1,4-alpha-glucosidase
VRRARYPPIAEYALIGDCHGSALVHQTGSIDWACLLRFDSPCAFGRLLDAERGGYWSLGPAADGYQVSRRYLDDSMILETTHTSAAGAFRVFDFFAMRRGGRTRPYKQLVRIVEGIRGESVFATEIRPRFDYGALRPWLRNHEDIGTYSAVGGEEAFVLSHGCHMKVRPETVSIHGGCPVKAGDRVAFSLVSSAPHLMINRALTRDEIDERFAETLDWWHAWVAAGRYEGDYREPVQRSAMVLKLLSSAATGAIVAAPTTSLPEREGGERNWDYRYCWLRDASLTMSALYITGHQEVAEGFKGFIERSTAGRAEDAQIMYGCYGERRLPESTLDLEGYAGSRPVRIGNAAHLQRQHDIYGELLDASYLWRRAGHPIPEAEWEFLRSLVEEACRIWQAPDSGIWEVRSAPKHFVHSKVMCWVTLDRGIRLAEHEGLPAELARWRAARSAIRADVEQNGTDPARGCFVQHYGTTAIDASLLRLSHLGFVAPGDPRMKATVRAVGEDLLNDGFVYRYRTGNAEDGVPGGEGTFLICTFWYVDALVLEGRLDEAEVIFRRLTGIANDLGLFAEEYDAVRGRMLGNFPQAYTHMALINSAYMIHLARHGTPRLGRLGSPLLAIGPRLWLGAGE